jgi:hypothetical protein
MGVGARGADINARAGTALLVVSGIGTNAEAAWPHALPLIAAARAGPSDTGDPGRHYRQKAIMPKKMVVPTSGGIGVEAGTVLFGEERFPNINFHLHCHRLEPRIGVGFAGVSRSTCRAASPKSHVAAQDGNAFQGGGSGEGRGTDLAAPVLGL